MINLILNLFWMFTFGWLAGLALFMLGMCCCFTLIGIPAGMACLRLIPVVMFPFGQNHGRRGEGN